MRALLLLTAALAWVQVQGAERRVCYFTNWSQYRQGHGKYFPENIDAHLCTHIAIAFAKMTDKLGPLEWNDESTPYRKGTFDKIVSLKKANPNLKILLAIGGWNAHSVPFNRALESQSKTTAFAVQAANYIRSQNMDGLDVDWEYPTNKAKYNIFIKTLRDAFDAEATRTGKERLLLTSAVPAGKNNIDKGFDVPYISKLMDFITVMTYDLHGSWEKVTGHHSAMFPGQWETGSDRYLNVDWIMNYWHNLGVPKSKLNLGLPTYGRCFTLKSESQNGVDAPAMGAGTPGKYTGEKGFLSYYEICDMIKKGAQKKFIADQSVPYLVMGNQWCGFDDIPSLRMKVQYTKTKGYGGIAVWSLALDDFSGVCGQKYPLMNAILDEMKSNRTFTSPTIPSPERSTRKLTSDAWKNTITTTKTPSTSGKPRKGDPCTIRDVGFKPDPYDCKKFWMCVHGKGYVRECPTSTLWNQASSVCDWEDNVICAPSAEI